MPLIDGKYRFPPELPNRATPSIETSRFHRLTGSLWNMLAHEHDGMRSEAAAWKETARLAAEALDQLFASEWGEQEAKLVVAHARSCAAADFARDLEEELNPPLNLFVLMGSGRREPREVDWRARRGTIPGCF